MCGLYCLLLLPEASSAHGMMRRLNKGFPPAAVRSVLSDEPNIQSDDRVDSGEGFFRPGKSV